MATVHYRQHSNHGVRGFSSYLKAVRDASRSSPAGTPDNARAKAASRYLRDEHGSEYISPGATNDIHKAAMGINTGTVGGYLLPPTFSEAILYSLVEKSFLYPRCRRIEMDAVDAVLPAVNLTAPVVVGNSAMFGGMTVSWSYQPTTVAETEPAFRQVALHAWDLIANCIVSNQFINDLSEGGERALMDLFSECLKWFFEWSVINGQGEGVSMPLGILNSPALLTPTRAVKSQIAAADIASMAADLLPSSWHSAIWICSPTALQLVGQSSNFSLNRPTTDEFEGSVGAILTRPLFVSDKLPPLNSTGDLMLIDPKLYLIGRRQEILIEASDLDPTYFVKQQTVFRIHLRMDGRPWVSSTITLPDTSTVTSPYIGLLTHA